MNDFYDWLNKYKYEFFVVRDKYGMFDMKEGGYIVVASEYRSSIINNLHNLVNALSLSDNFKTAHKASVELKKLAIINLIKIEKHKNPLAAMSSLMSQIQTEYFLDINFR